MRWLLVLGCAAGCAPARPKVSGADLYANVAALQRLGRATVPGQPRALVVRGDQLLGSDTQTLQVSEVIQHCAGGDPDRDGDCVLASLRDRRFAVRDPPRIADDAHPSLSAADERVATRRAILISGTAIGARSPTASSPATSPAARPSSVSRSASTAC